VRLQGVQVDYGARRRLARLGSAPSRVRAVDDVDLDIDRGSIVALVGESGSGKTTLGRVIVGLERPSGGTFTHAGRGDLPASRRAPQMVFQDARASLSPRLRVGALVTEPYRIHGIAEPDRSSVAQLLAAVGLGPELADQYPHQLSGGQARRVAIARSLALEPELLVADEPTAGLDAAATAALLELLGDLRDRRDMTYLIITHDLDVAAALADRIAVMYLGQIVEDGPIDRVLDAPLHPYTQMLLASIPPLDPRRRDEWTPPVATSEVPSASRPPPGCRFHTRCPHATERCRTETPHWEQAAAQRHLACHHWKELE
jgi:peptide/nickel transport system ATP-binding protein